MKRWHHPTILQWRSFLLSMPIIEVALMYIMYAERIFHEPGLWLIVFPLLFALGICSWRGHVLLGNYVKKRYPNLNQTKQRVAWLAFLVVPFMSFSILTIFYLFEWLNVKGYTIAPGHLMNGLMVGWSVNLIFETLYEADYALLRYREVVEQKRQMQQINAMHEFDTLKNQVNPHFLFNCFNTLSSLITEDKVRADKFLNELSNVYRYLLRNNEDGMSTVEKEVRFIKSYYQLLQTRHGEAVTMNLDIDSQYLNYLLPSLSLQLLVENVVKHNVLSKTRPLTIEIFTTTGNKLVVNNNLQRRTIKAPSNRVGLENIRTKYELLGQHGFQVVESEKNFMVVLPLIWNNPQNNSKLYQSHEKQNTSI